TTRRTKSVALVLNICSFTRSKTSEERTQQYDRDTKTASRRFYLPFPPSWSSGLSSFMKIENALY
ncbi:unnamed protein product, partial [Amoebophrya sp. A120]